MPYEIDFLPVGTSNGDAICIRYGDTDHGYFVHVVDAGYVDTGQIVVDHIRDHYGDPGYIDNLVLTHSDRDHSGGMKTVLEKLGVGTIWMNRPWLYAEEIVGDFHNNYTVQGLRNKLREAFPVLAELEDIALARGIEVREVFAGHAIGPFRVLAPMRHRYIKSIADFDQTPAAHREVEEQGILAVITRAGQKVVEKAKQLFSETWDDEQLSEKTDPTTALNESSVVQYGLIDNRALLLTADAGPTALHEAADVAEHLGIKQPLNFVQIPHHGSRRNVTPSALNRWLGGLVPEGTIHGTAFCSVGSDNPEYPRRRVKNAFLRRGFSVNSSRKGWIRSYSGMPPRAGETPLASDTFETVYEE